MNIIILPQPIMIYCFINLYHIEWRFKLAEKKGYYHIGFIDPSVLNCKNLHTKIEETFQNVYKYLSI